MTSHDDRVVVGTTLPPFVMDQQDTWAGWLYNAEAMAVHHPNLEFFAAIEVDSRGLDPFEPLLARFAELHEKGIKCSHFTFSIDDGATEITTGNRLRRITMGQNIVSDYCRSELPDWLLFLAADCAPEPAAIPKLLELNHPLVGGHVSTYCLDGPIVAKYVPKHGDLIRQHMATAAFVMLHHRVYNAIGWRYDRSNGMTDDPCLHHDAQTLLGIPTFVHHGVIGEHYPACIGPIESRGHDMRIH